MNTDITIEHTEQWKCLCEKYQTLVLQDTLQFIQMYASQLVDEFYKNMMLEKEASEFLSDEIVQSRLKNTLKQWLNDCFNVPFSQEYQLLAEKQLKVGTVHSRIGIPSWLIIRGIREIEKKIFSLMPDNTVENMQQLHYMIEVLSLSSEIMCRSYEANLEQNNDIKHTYRLFSAMQDVAVQKDKQRSVLLDWENELIFKIFSDTPNTHHLLLSKSEFGLWFIHKAAYAFTGSTQVTAIINTIYEVDELYQAISDLQQKADIIQTLQRIRSKNREIHHLVEQLFQVAEYIDSGNDPLTKLLNRRYLNTILSREINFSRKNNVPLSLLALDADFFKNINDTYGHDAGDLALQFIAEVLLDSVKGSDYAFRIGGEEFLLLLVDSDQALAQSIAEQIRQRIEKTPLRTIAGRNFYFTVSIGVACYDGHPDYQRFLNAADTALYSAKHRGRNVVAF